MVTLQLERARRAKSKTALRVKITYTLLIDSKQLHLGPKLRIIRSTEAHPLVRTAHPKDLLHTATFCCYLIISFTPKRHSSGQQTIHY